MSEAIEDFWPEELPNPTDPAPVAFLKEQAALLDRRTQGDVKGVVRTSTEGGTAYYSLYLKADTLRTGLDGRTTASASLAKCV